MPACFCAFFAQFCLISLDFMDVQFSLLDSIFLVFCFLFSFVQIHFNLLELSLMFHNFNLSLLQNLLIILQSFPSESYRDLRNVKHFLYIRPFIRNLLQCILKHSLKFFRISPTYLWNLCLLYFQSQR